MKEVEILALNYFSKHGNFNFKPDNWLGALIKSAAGRFPDYSAEDLSYALIGIDEINGQSPAQVAKDVRKLGSIKRTGKSGEVGKEILDRYGANSEAHLSKLLGLKKITKFECLSPLEYTISQYLLNQDAPIVFEDKMIAFNVWFAFFAGEKDTVMEMLERESLMPVYQQNTGIHGFTVYGNLIVGNESVSETKFNKAIAHAIAASDAKYNRIAALNFITPAELIEYPNDNPSDTHLLVLDSLYTGRTLSKIFADYGLQTLDLVAEKARTGWTFYCATDECGSVLIYDHGKKWKQIGITEFIHLMESGVSPTITVDDVTEIINQKIDKWQKQQKSGSKERINGIDCF